MVKSDLSTYWTKKEAEIGRTISVYEVSKATGIPWDTIAKMKDGKTQRFDSHVIARICSYFDVDEGELVPFLRVYYDDDNTDDGKAA